MKTTLVSIFAATALLLSAPDAFAQDDDDDLFGEGGDGDGDGDGGGEVTPPGDDDDDGGNVEPAPAVVAGDGMASGTIGAGFSATANGITGIEVEYWLSEGLMAGGLARMQLTAVDGADTAIGITVGGGAFFALKRHDKAALLFGGRFLLGFTSGDAGTTSIAIEAPLRLHMQMHKNVSVHVEGGLVLAIADQAALGGNGLNNFGFAFGSTNVFGNAGITFYLP